MSTAPLPIGGGYVADGVIGRGATAVVLGATDRSGRPVAIKLLRDTAQEPLLRSEFARLARLEHPNLVKVHDIGRLSAAWRSSESEQPLARAGALYVVMDRIDGVSGAARLGAVSPSRRDEILRSISEDLAEALMYLHARGLVHHDVKPSNVLVDQRGRAVLLDLGLASAHAENARGTVAYMAPEALMSHADPRADLYSLGATLYELAEGRPPLGGEGSELIRAILERTPPPPRAAWLGAGTRKLIARLLRKAPGQRPASARAVRAELARIAGDHARVATLSSAPELMPPAFVGRSPELEALSAGLESAQRARIIGVVGEPGAGKSRLIHEGLTRRRVGYAARIAEPIELIEEPGSLLTDVRATGPALEADASLDDRASVVIEALSERSVTCVLSLRLGGRSEDALSRRVAQMIATAGAPAVVVIAECDTRQQLSELSGGDAEVQLLELGPLSDGEVGELVGSMLGRPCEQRQRERLLARSGGNPALLAELVRHGAMDTDLPAAPPAHDGEPMASLQRLLARRRELCDRQQRALVDGLAVWGRAASAEQLAVIAGCDVDEINAAVERPDRFVETRGGLLELPSAAHYRVWRETVASAERRALHRRAAEIASDPGERAEHLLAGHDASELSQSDGKAVLDGALDLARRHRTTRALQLMRQLCALLAPSSPHRLSASRELVRLLERAGAYDEVLGLLAPDGEAAEIADEPAMQLLRAGVLRRRGDYEAAETVLQRLLPELQQGQRAEALAMLGWVLLRRGDPQGALAICDEPARQLCATPEGTKLDRHGAAVIEVAGQGLYYLGELERAEEYFCWGERSLSATEHPALAARLSCNRGMVCFSRGQLAQAALHYERALTQARRAADAHGAAIYAANLGSVKVELGRLGEAMKLLGWSVDRLSSLGHSAQLGWALSNLGWLMVQLGDLDRARQLHQRGVRVVSRAATRQNRAVLDLLAAELARRAGDDGVALRGYRQVESEAGRQGAAREVQLALSAQLDLLLEQDRTAEAQEVLERMAAHERSQQDDADVRAWLALGRARVALAGGDDGADRAEVARVIATHCAALEGRGAADRLWRAAGLLGRLLVASGQRQAGWRAIACARRQLEEIMDHAPDVYRETLGEDPEVRSLASQWQALVGEGAAQRPDGSVQPARTKGPAYDEVQLRRLLAINKRLNSELRLPRLLEMILDAVIDLTDAERGFLILVEDDETLSVKVARNIDQQHLEGEQLELSRSIAERAARRGEPVVTIDAADDERFQLAVSVSDLRLRSVLAVPLTVKGRTVGTIYVDHRLRSGAFGEQDVALVQDFADQAAIAIENARLMAENQRRQGEIEQLNHQLADRLESSEAQLQQAREELRSNRRALAVRHDYTDIVGRTPRMLELFRLLDRVVDTELPVVILGESGTGKELVARAIHFNGQRARRPFVTENCGAIPETLLESILFGTVRGAFTGADRDRKGLFEVADGGTLFLDEVGEMSPAMQTKLLRVLQDGVFRRVGGERARKVDVRVIAASNRDLQQMVRDGTFREDLFYRLHVIRIEIPPLRERREDILLLADHFLQKHSSTPRRISQTAMARLMGYSWPGNVRELENEMMRVAALGGALIDTPDLSPQIGDTVPLELADADDLSLKPRVEHLERELITRALERSDGNQSEAARTLGLSRYGLLKKLKRYFPERYDRKPADGA